MVTMLDVANRAGVSKSTVSRVLNGKNIVRPDVAKKVFDAIQETGYRPNLLAQQLATKKTNFIGFVITNELFNGPYFSSLMYHAASYSEKSNHQLVITDGKHSAEDERKAINFLLDMKCAGIIIYPQCLSESEIAQIIDSTDTPILVLNREMPSKPEHAITTDHYHSACLMVEHIIDLGHTEIAVIRGKADSSTDEQRYQAYQDVLTKHDIELNQSNVAQGNWTMESGYRAAQALVESKASFTAILSENDDMAIGAIRALTELGYSLPQDISIVGFDNSKVGEFLTPSLTSVSVPLEQMTQKAILQIVGGSEQADAIDTTGSLVIRDSVAQRT
ncbi:DNA-binding transcriptional repressor AscG [Vibrio crassostreae]|uniref:LacI family DNA-binding transcriptional regulator n=1 Tax=Vibrio crassostreae TaxID=246167 RepID=UPI00104F5D4B|nr:LacI family DNA-binding transcriptional regulator [Vibrio crassostreae]TCN76359.1 LacI family transcriptional regulator [Vibrio crassostreae]CAK2520593.1 DNA-binding transcriptional repressor AscG [Vibrio crassostreae]CAK2532975.1 DNA-binding transcriptional repressor AscG [Vibrio crassostreae]CAK3882936.1 DNA-binding transcriptional repressor AscG [Vibrio crassostreae]CAK4015410.1 DNA-binding transcriptional repressor AscG [Vibrio crassostreae]